MANKQMNKCSKLLVHFYNGLLCFCQFLAFYVNSVYRTLLHTVFKYFFAFYRLSFHFSMSFQGPTRLIFMKFSLSVFSLFACFGATSKKSLPNPRS